MKFLVVLGTWVKGPRRGRSTEDRLSPHGVVSLQRMRVGAQGKVIGVEGGPVSERSLAQLHVRIGSSLRVVRTAPWGGPVLVETWGGTVAVGRGLASKVRVRIDE